MVRWVVSRRAMRERAKQIRDASNPDQNNRGEGGKPRGSEVRPIIDCQQSKLPDGMVEMERLRKPGDG